MFSGPEPDWLEEKFKSVIRRRATRYAVLMHALTGRIRIVGLRTTPTGENVQVVATCEAAFVEASPDAWIALLEAIEAKFQIGTI